MEIEEAHRKVRGEEKKVEKKPEQKKESSEKEKKELRENREKTAEELAEEQQEEESLQGKPHKEADLEEIARKGTARRGGSPDSEYVEELAHKPIGEIYQEIKDIYRIVEDKGYLNALEQRQVEYLSTAVQKKFEAEERGTYSFSEEAARAASVTQQLSASMIGSYKGKKMNEMYK